MCLARASHLKVNIKIDPVSLSFAPIAGGDDNKQTTQVRNNNNNNNWTVNAPTKVND